jgi:lycopene cyclase domain-containing protein
MLPEKYYYLIIDVASFAFPFLFSFHPRIKFYKEWKFYIPSMLLTALLFVVWDEWFTRMNVWGFNSKYLMGIYIGHLPLEEILFFVFIPYCLSFMFHCLPLGIKINEQNSRIKYLNWVIAISIFIVGIISIHQWYTGFTCIATAIFISTILLLDKKNNFPWKQFWLTYLLGLIPFFIVNGLLTSLPIVTYNNAENLGIRITTIPLEDSVYNLLLFLCNIIGVHLSKHWFNK